MYDNEYKERAYQWYEEMRNTSLVMPELGYFEMAGYMLDVSHIELSIEFDRRYKTEHEGV